jgi:hypothetical protein
VCHPACGGKLVRVPERSLLRELSACPHDAEASQQSVVAKRLKLGRLSPVFLAAYRADEIDLEEAQAFALSDDHAEQERLQ